MKVLIDKEDIQFAGLTEDPIGIDVLKGKPATADFNDFPHMCWFRFDNGHGDFAFAHAFEAIKKMHIGSHDGK